MEGSAVPLNPSPKFEPNVEKIKQKLIEKGVHPTPKITHNLRKKEIQKHNRKLNRLARQSLTPPLTPSQKQTLDEESHFLTVKREFRDFNRAVKPKNGNKMTGMPWESVDRARLKEIAGAYGGEDIGEDLKREKLMELREMFEERKREELQLFLDDDVDLKEEWFSGENLNWDVAKRRRNEGEAIRYLVARLSAKEISKRDWKFTRVLKQCGLQFTEVQLIKIVEGLGAKGSWKQAMSVVEWVYSDKASKRWKSRFVYTKLLTVLGKARRPHEAIQIFNLMRGDCHIYPDMAAYHSIAVTLGQAGLLKELLSVMQSMRQKPSKNIKNIHKNWDPLLEPDVVIYNAVLNACVPSCQWKGVYWVFKQLRKSGQKPNGATYGLAMEVMLQSGKYDLVHEFFRKMKKSGEAPKALTYRVLVRAFWEEGNVNEAVKAVRDMEQRGVVGTASVYYELACCLCRNGRWEDALVEVDKMKRLRDAKPLAVTFTGMIMSSMEGDHVDSCISIFKHMKNYCMPNIGTINVMLKVYGQNDMFSEAKELFEDIKRSKSDTDNVWDAGSTSLIPDEYTYSSMLEASARALQWEYFEYVYREMTLSGYHVDHSKHAWLLVKASRAGKSYLLEHAFDMLLEAGEIPDPSFFTELVLQAAAQENYDRAINLVNAMSYAPFQMNESQWVDFFKKNRERINTQQLRNLLDALNNCDLASEATVSNLFKSLNSICGIIQLKNSLGSDAVGDNAIDGNTGGKHDDEAKENVPKFIANVKIENCVPDEVPLSSNKDAVQVVNYTDNNEEDDTDIATMLPTDVCNDNEASLRCYMMGFDDEEDDNDDINFGGLNDCLEDKPTRSTDTPTACIDNLDGLNSPSAYEILETWKESRKRTGN